MSLWNEEYANKMKEIEKDYPRYDIKELVKAHIENFVGTLATIEAEKQRIEAVFKEEEKLARKIYYEKINSLIEEYCANLFAEYTVPKIVCDMAYSLASERGCHSGYDEVESHFDEYMEAFVEVYNIGFKNGKEI